MVFEPKADNKKLDLQEDNGFHVFLFSVFA